MEIICGNKKLVYANRICCFDNDAVELHHKFNDNDILSIKFMFRYDEANLRYELSSPENGRIELILYNFKNPMGTGLKQPIEIAQYKDKGIYLVFFVFKLDQANPILDLALYLED